MKEKKTAFMLMILIAAVTSLSGCGDKTVSADIATGVTTVKVERVSSTNFENAVSYSGYVSADEMKKFSFELGGTIEDVKVEKGDRVVAGQVLAVLDTTAVKLAIDNANKNIELAQNQIKQIDGGIEQLKLGLEAEKLTLEKAMTGIEAERLTLKKIEDTYNSNISKLQLKYDNIKTTYDDTATMYNQGVVTRSDYDNAKLAFDTVEEELSNALESKANDMSLQQKKIDSLESDYKLQETSIKNSETELNNAKTKRDAAVITQNQAKISLEQNNKYLNDSVLKSTIDGYVMEIVMNAGEVTGAGTPVVVVKSGAQVVNVGVPVDEYDKLYTGMSAIIEQENVETKAEITAISLYPDETTRTYNVEFTPIGENNLVMGSLVNVKIPIEEKNGCMVPISSIVNIEGVNYIYYVVPDEGSELYKVMRQEISLGDTKSNYILADDIDAGMLVISEGVKDVNENQLVAIGDDLSGQ